MDSIAQDVRFALRSLRKRICFIASAVIALGLGIAATTSMFSVVDGVLVRDLPFPNPGELVSLWTAVPEWRGKEGYDYLWDHMPFGWEEARDIPEQTRTLSEVAAFRTTGVLLGGGDSRGRELVSVGMASANLFDLLGVSFSLGRNFSVEEVPVSGVGTASVAILSHEVWTRRYGSDRSILGRSVEVNGRPHVVIGVLPPDFRLSSDGYATFYTRGGVDSGLRDLWLPIVEGPGNELIARLAPGATVEQARTEIQALVRQEKVDERFVETLARVAPRKEVVTKGFGPLLFLLLGASATLLIVVCVSVAGLLIAEGIGRQRELAVRSALGAGQWRVLRLLLTESLLLGLMASVLGVALSWISLDTLLALAPPIPRAEEIGIDWRALLAGGVLGIGTGTVAGVVPALNLITPSISKVLGGRGQSEDTSSRSLQESILTAQVALAVILLVGGGLFARSVLKLLDVDLGFDPDGLVVMEAVLPPSEEEGIDFGIEYADLWGEVVRAVESTPGVQTASATSSVPFGGLTGNDYFSFQGESGRVDVTIAASRRVWPNYHEAMAIRLLSGEHLSARGPGDGPSEIVVSASLAEQIWRADSPLGTLVNYYGRELVVVGVVEDVRKKALGSPPEPVFYLPASEFPILDFTIVARIIGNSTDAFSAMRNAIHSVNPEISLSTPKAMTTLMMESEADDRFRAILVLVFAGVAMVMAALGIFGVTARSVANRIRELGIRKAVGATDRDLMSLVIRDGLRSGLIGCAVGLVAALGVTRVISHFLFGIESYDPLTYLGVASVLVTVCLVAAWVPARRAMWISPMEAIGEE